MRLVSRLTHGPSYPSDRADAATVRIAGLEMPWRATVAITVTTLALLFDFSRTFIPEHIQDLGRLPEAIRFQALERVVVFGLVPLLVVVGVFRDRPAAYGLRLGDWRLGLALAIAGSAAMTPIVLWAAAEPSFREYYAFSATGLADMLVTNVLDLVPTEFLFRGFFMFAMIRAFGPIGVLIATMPFVFSHLGKPEFELFSTLLGGLVYGWLNWRTGSIVWSAAAHIYILTLILWAAGGGAP
jgi:membrane protease YdiL (CAAX protease family)